MSAVDGGYAVAQRAAGLVRQGSFESFDIQGLGIEHYHCLGG
jgi:hypothetical protein